MIAKVKSDLDKMKKDRAGERFKNEHKRAKESGAATGWVRIVFLIAAIVSFAVGVVLVFIPGPAFVFFILSGALVATQWWKAAKALDKTELWLRDCWSWGKKKWKSCRKSPDSPAAKPVRKTRSKKVS